MITGFNTDIEYEGVVYHVQTEDKGLESPLILSLVYAGGAILASKRSRYEDLIEAGFDEEALAQRVKKQHRLICAAINAGRIEDLKKMGAKEAKAAEPEAEPLEITTIGGEPLEITTVSGDFASLAESQAAPESIPITDNASDYAHFAETAPPPVVEEPPAPPPPPPDPSPYTVYDSRRQSPLGEAAEPDKSLVLSVLDEEDYRAGQTYQIRMRTEDLSGANGKPLSGVTLSVKILGTGFRPQLYSVKTERDGVAVVSAKMPAFKTGRAAVLIRATSHGRTTEIRRVIHPNL